MKRAVLSASNLGAAALCPAKPRLEAPFSEEETEWSIRGTRLHRYFRTDLDRSQLSEDDRDLLSRADTLSEALIEDFKTACGISDDEICTDEHEVAMEGIVPGHADNILTWRGGRYACILDLKSGVRPADEAPDNWQLASYALLQYVRTAFEACYVAIIQPDAFGPRVTNAIYKRMDMLDVAKAIRDVVDATESPTEAPVAGPKQCHYCRAKLVCPAYEEKVSELTTIGPKAIWQLDNERLVKVHQAIQFANRIRDDVQDELRARIENGTLPGKLRPTGTTRELVEPQGLWEDLFARYSEHPKFSAARYDRCRKLSFGDFEDLIRELEGCTIKRAKEIGRELSAAYVVETAKAPVPIPEVQANLTPAN